MTNRSSKNRTPGVRVVMATLLVAVHPLACGDAASDPDVGSAADETSGEERPPRAEPPAPATEEPSAVAMEAALAPGAADQPAGADLAPAAAEQPMDAALGAEEQPPQPDPVTAAAGQPGVEPNSEESANEDPTVVAMEPAAPPVCTPEDYADELDAGDYPDCVRG